MRGEGEGREGLQYHLLHFPVSHCTFFSEWRWFNSAKDVADMPDHRTSSST
jgi:hypothetical protein